MPTAQEITKMNKCRTELADIRKRLAFVEEHNISLCERLNETEDKLAVAEGLLKKHRDLLFKAHTYDELRLLHDETTAFLTHPEVKTLQLQDEYRSKHNELSMR